MTIAERLKHVRQRIAEACLANGRSPDDVELVAVSKRHQPDAIREAYAAGQRVFGESYVQELEEKVEAMSEFRDCTFRFVGRVQRNKAKRVIQVSNAVDSVDSVRLAEALERHGRELGIHRDILIQVNANDESNKAGVSFDALPELVACCSRMAFINLNGLMVIPSSVPELAQEAFRRLRDEQRRRELPVLSMGMSGDLEKAIAYGSTQVRVGTAIFGPRSY